MSETTPQKTWFYQFARKILVVFSALFYPCKLLTPSGFDISGPYLLACNHQSMMDPVLLAVKNKKTEIHFIGKRELTKFKPLKWVVERLHLIAISRHMSDLHAIRMASNALKAGHVVGIFPEGGRRQGMPMENIESGVSILAMKNKVPLFPVIIIGRPKPFRRTLMAVGAPIPYEDLLSQGIDMNTSQQLNNRIQQVYVDLYKKYNKKTMNP